MANIYLLDSDTITALSEKNPVAEQNLKAVQQEDEIVICFILTAE